MRLLTLSASLLVLSLNLLAQAPAGYYDNAKGLKGTALKSALHQIIKNHTSIPYGDIDQYFPQTDRKSNGKVWDMYSYVFSGSQPYEYTYGVHECDAGLQYNSEADCFNKEHIWPQSYFNSQAVPRSDLHHLYPTDGWVNNKRANYPYGYVSQVNWTSDNGSKVGASNDYAGYTGKVFEPIDSFKGDIARAIFYTATRYYTESSGWSDWAMADGSTLTDDAITLLLSWHHSDPVSTKEIDRNNKIYGIQNNRNPYIDHPGLVDCIWGADCEPLGMESLQPYLDYKLVDQVLQLSDEAEEVVILDSTGRTISQSSNISRLDLNKLGAGMYIILISNKDDNFVIKTPIH